jgi:hypothetical protein
VNDFDEQLFEEVLQLVDGLLCARATAQEIDRLDQLVQHDQRAYRLYVDLMYDARQLRCCSCSHECMG